MKLTMYAVQRDDMFLTRFPQLEPLLWSEYFHPGALFASAEEANEAFFLTPFAAVSW